MARRAQTQNDPYASADERTERAAKERAYGCPSREHGDRRGGIGKGTLELRAGLVTPLSVGPVLLCLHYVDFTQLDLGYLAET